MSAPEMQKTIVWDPRSGANRTVETSVQDPQGGRWVWFVEQTREEGWTWSLDLEAVR